MEYRYTAIVIGKRNIGEADRIYTIYTREAGKIQAKAVGIRKQNAKLAGALENFTLASIAVVKKQGMGKITTSIVENNFPHLRNDLEALAAAWKSAKIIDRLVGLEAKDPVLFSLLREYLEALDEIVRTSKEKESLENQEKIELVTLGFTFKLLEALGYKAEVNNCVECGRVVSLGGNYLDVEKGGIICKHCRGGRQNAIGTGDNTVKLIRIFSRNKISSLQKLRVQRKEIDELNAISQKFLEWVVK
ncbi:MAG: DNA repair protein RecO [Candidatus Moranbacteria bacterium]|nr:DNA repair protein RecO [Candidatus Moranbacteria bacterium]